MLMENDFLQSLRSFDKDHIPVPVVQKIKPYIANPEFEPNKILTVSMHLFCIFTSAVICAFVFLLLHPCIPCCAPYVIATVTYQSRLPCMHHAPSSACYSGREEDSLLVQFCCFCLLHVPIAHL